MTGQIPRLHPVCGQPEATGFRLLQPLELKESINYIFIHSKYSAAAFGPGATAFYNLVPANF